MTDAQNRAGATVLVTGVAGFIGSALSQRLRAAGHRVVGYDNLSRGRREYLPHDVPLVEGDVRDAAQLQETVRSWKPQWLIHLAAMHFIPDCIARPLETIEVNVEGTRRVLDAARGSSVEAVIFASTAAVYAPVDEPCVEDVTALAPLEIYGESKLAAERQVRTFYEQTGVATTILRLFNAIGRNETNPHLIPHILESLQRSDEIKVGNTAPRRDYIDTRDVAEAILAVAESSDGLRVFNVGTGVTHSAEDVVDALRRALGRPIAMVQEASRVRAVERMVLAADISRIRRASRWAPRFSLEDTLKDLIAEYGLLTQPHSAR